MSNENSVIDTRISRMTSGYPLERISGGFGSGELVESPHGGCTKSPPSLSERIQTFALGDVEPEAVPDVSKCEIVPGETPDKHWHFENAGKIASRDISIEEEFADIGHYIDFDRGKNLKFDPKASTKVINVNSDIEGEVPYLLEQDAARSRDYEKDRSKEIEILLETIQKYGDELLADITQLAVEDSPEEKVLSRVSMYLVQETAISFSIMESLEVDLARNSQGEPYFIFKYEGTYIFGKGTEKRLERVR